MASPKAYPSKFDRHVDLNRESQLLLSSVANSKLAKLAGTHGIHLQSVRVRDHQGLIRHDWPGRTCFFKTAILQPRRGLQLRTPLQRPLPTSTGLHDRILLSIGNRLKILQHRTVPRSHSRSLRLRWLKLLAIVHHVPMPRKRREGRGGQGLGEAELLLLFARRCLRLLLQHTRI